MRRYKTHIFSLVTLGAAITALLGSGAAASAATTRAATTRAATAGAALARVYVSPHGSRSNSGNSCRAAGFWSINQAIAAARSHGTVIVCRGTYHTQAVIHKPLTLIGERAVINAKGQKPVLPKLPGGSGIVVLGTRQVSISGFMMTGAGFDAILVAHVIAGNWIGTNNVVGDPIGLGPPVKNVPDLRTTGILVGASSRVHVTIRGNHISRNWYGIFLEGRVSATLHRNHYRRVHVPVKVVP